MRFSRLLAFLSLLAVTEACTDRDPMGPLPPPRKPSFAFSTIAADGAPYGATVSSNGIAWVSFTSTSLVKRLNVATGQFSDSASTGASTIPQQLAANATGTRLYVANNDTRPANAGLILSLNTSSHAVMDSMRVTGDATAIISTPAGDTVYVGTVEGSLYKLDLTHQAILQSRSLPSAGSYHFIWDRAHTRLFASSLRHSMVYQVDPATLAVDSFQLGGHYPTGIALSSDETKLFIADSGSTSITVWNVATKTQVSTISTGCKGTDLLRLSDNSRLYEGCDGTIVAVDPDSGTMIGTYSLTDCHAGCLQPTPGQFVFDPGTRKVISPNAAGWVNLIDAAPASSGNGLPSGPFGSVVTGIETAWITQSTARAAQRLNVPTGLFTGSALTGPDSTLAVQIDRNSDGSRVYVANFDQRSANRGLVVSINTSTRTIVDSVRVPAGDATGIIATPTGDTVIVGITDGQIYRIALPSKTVVASRTGLPTAGAYHFAWNQSRSLLYAANTNSGRIYELKADSLNIIRTFTDTAKRPQGIAFSSDWSNLYAADQKTGIVVWSIASGTELSVISTGCRGYGLLRLPDNSRLYDSCTLDGKVVTLDPRDPKPSVKETYPVGGRPRELSYAPRLGQVIVPNELGWVDYLDAPTQPPVGWFVAPGCTSSGNGTYASPWNLQTALNGGSGTNLVQPGDTVWLLGGTYKCANTFDSQKSGTSSAAVSFRPYPGHRVTLDAGDNPLGTLLTVHSDYTVFWGIEFTNSDPTRHIAIGDSGIDRSHLIYNQGKHNKFLNLVLHDGGVGLLTEPPAEDVEIAGCIVYDNGFMWPWSDTTGYRGHGHGLYLINTLTSSDSILAHDNVLFNQFANGVQATSDPDPGKSLHGIRITGNVVFNNGVLADSGPRPQNNIIVGSLDPSDAFLVSAIVDTNATYISPDAPKLMAGKNVVIGLDGHLNRDATVRGNYIVGGGHDTTAALEVDRWQTVTFNGNTVIGCQPQVSNCPSGSGIALLSASNVSTSGQTWSLDSLYRDSTQASWRFLGTLYDFPTWRSTSHINTSDRPIAGSPAITRVFVRHSRYKPSNTSTGRAMVAVYNWQGLGSVSVSMDGIIPTDPPRAYEIRNVQDPFGDPIVKGVFTGGSVNIPISAVPPPTPVGDARNSAPALGTRFNAYFVSWTP
ncbi:MAG TPA: hypothetical protein VIV83_13695 [Gemmatimonadales bacterium]|jgi:DNA-binding beta-propeller fold protein YncE